MADLGPTTQRIRTTTLNAYLNKRVELVYPEAPLLAMLKAYGRMTFNNSGREIHWFPRVRRREAIASIGEQTEVVFPAVATQVEARLPWRHYYMSERLSRFEKLVNKGKYALFPLVQRVSAELMDDFNFHLRTCAVKDGDAGNQTDLHGFESYLSDAGIEIANTPCLVQNDNYAGLSTARSDLGGAWSGSWPNGTGDAEYCSWSPIIINSGSTFWDAAGGSWSGYWQQIVRYGFAFMRRLWGLTPKLLVMTADMVRQAKDSVAPIQRLEVTAQSKLVDLGVRTLNFEGVELTDDYSVADDTAYLIAPEHIEMRCLTPKLVQKYGDEDITTSTERIMVEFYGNLVTYTPVAVCKIRKV